MRYQLQYRPYHRVFHRPVRLGAYPATTRDGIVLRLEDDDGRVGFGELAPLESFGSESVEKALQALKSFCGVIRDEGMEELNSDAFPCLRDALECARNQLQNGWQRGGSLPVVNSAMLVQSHQLDALAAESDVLNGARVWKLKIGEGEADLDREIAQVKEWTQVAKRKGWRLRLDANERLSLDTAQRWVESLEACSDVIEFLEQPLDRWLVEDLLNLSDTSPVPIALDESLPLLPGWGLSPDERSKFWFVVKPSLGDLRWVSALQLPADRVVISSVFETAIGFARLLELAPFEVVPGLQTQNVFADELSYPQEGAGFVPGALNPVTIWERLS